MKQFLSAAGAIIISVCILGCPGTTDGGNIIVGPINSLPGASLPVPRGIISGTITSDSPGAFAEPDVRLWLQDGSQEFLTMYDFDGPVEAGSGWNFEFRDAQPGSYVLKVTADNHDPLATIPFTLSDNAGVSGKHITLVKHWNVETVAAYGTLANYLSIPAGIAIANDKIYVADMGAYQIRRTILGNVPQEEPFSFVGTETPGNGEGINTAALFNSPQAIVVKEGTLTTFYVADSGNRTTLQGTNVPGNHRIIQITITEDGDKQVRLLAGSPEGDSGNENGTGDAARFNCPSGLALDGNTLYVADTENHKIRKINIGTRAVTTLALTRSLNQPSGLALDGRGNLYVAEVGGNLISKINLSTGHVYDCAGTGEAGYLNSTYSLMAKFDQPAGLAYHDGSLFVADMENHCVRRVNLTTGVVSTLAGDASVTDPEWFDGIGTAAKFTRPIGVAVYNGDVYVTDAFSPHASFLIRKLTADYEVED